MAPRRPLLWVALAFACGIVVGEMGGLPTRATWAGGAVFLALGAALVKTGRLRAVAAGATLLAVACGGGLYAGLRMGRGDSGLAGAERAVTAKVRGEIVGDPRIYTYQAEQSGRGAPGNAPSRSETGQAHRTTFPLDLSHVMEGVRWRRTWGRAQVVIQDRAATLQYGDVIDLTCRVAPPPTPRNPGQFDYGRFLRRRGVRAVARASEAANAVRSGRGSGSAIGRAVFGAKRLMRGFVERRMTPNGAAIIRCVILGERHALSERQQSWFRSTGTVHFLTVSGLHVAILAGTVWGICVLLRLRPRVAACVVMVFVCAYVVLGGMRPPILRAGIMTVVVCMGHLLGRRPSMPNALALAALVVLLIQPAEIFSAGFQLSFVAVAGISALSGRLGKAFFPEALLVDRLQAPEERGPAWHAVKRFAQAALCISVAAWIVTAPLTAYHFHYFTPLAPIANVVIVPVVWAVLLSGFPAVLLGPLLGRLMEPAVALADGAAHALTWITRTLSHVPGAIVYTPAMAVGWIALYYAYILFFLHRRRLGLRLGPALVGGLVLANVWAVAREGGRGPAGLEVTALDVGGGACVVVRVPEGHTLVYDAGSIWQMRAGQCIIAPFLWSRGATQIDCLVLSHADADHYNAVPALVERFRVGCVVLPVTFGRRGMSETLARSLRASGVRVLRVAAGDRIAGIGSAHVEVLYPFANMRSWPGFAPNDLSCTIRLTCTRGTALFTGDLQARGVTALLASHPSLQSGPIRADSGDPLRAALVLAPHHDLAPRVTDRLAARVRPCVALASTAIPARAGRPVHYTSQHGALTVRFRDDAECAVSSMLHGTLSK